MPTETVELATLLVLPYATHLSRIDMLWLAHYIYVCTHLPIIKQKEQNANRDISFWSR